MEPVGQFGRSLIRILIGASVGPFAKCGLNEALCLPLVRGVYGLVKIWRMPRRLQTARNVFDR